SSIDWKLATVVVGSFLVHFGCVGYLHSLDFPKRDISEAPERAVFPVQVRLPTPKADVPAKPEKLVEAPDPGSRGRGPLRSHTTANPESPAARQARLTESARTGLIKLLGSRGGQGSALQDVLSGGSVSADADEVFREVGGVGVHSASDG